MFSLVCDIFEICFTVPQRHYLATFIIPYCLPRDPMHSADYAVARCRSVCRLRRLSVTRRYSVETVIHILKHFTPSGSHTILVCVYQTVLQ